MPTFRLPAEWERQRCVQLTWPHNGTDWLPILPEITRTYVRMALEIARREGLLVVAQRVDEARRAIEAEAPSSVARNIAYMECDTNDTWARDHGFITLADGEGNFRLLDFRFNGWGGKFEASLDNAINAKVFPMLRETPFFGDAKSLEYGSHLDFVLEGGAIESDGRGTVFTTTHCLLAPGRNQPLGREEIECRLMASLCADRIVWLDHGSLEGDDTDGHIDTLVRVAPNDTLLYVDAGDDPSDPQREGLRLLRGQLSALRNARGEPYRLLPLPMPRPMVRDGERLPATYANFLVLNGAVLLPTYAQPDLDAEAAAVVEKAFPGREIVGIDCRSVIVQHGSLHCCTMQFPA